MHASSFLNRLFRVGFTRFLIWGLAFCLCLPPLGNARPRCGRLPDPHALEGLHPEARAALLRIVPKWRVYWTLENYPESGGTHAADPPRRTTAAADLYVSDLTFNQIRGLLETLGRAGFACWYRKPGLDGWPPAHGVHIHSIWVRGPLNALLVRQVWDYLAGENGLRSHARYLFYFPTPVAFRAVRKAFRERCFA